MKKFNIVLLIFFLFILSSCKGDYVSMKKIVFNTNGGDDLENITFKLGSFPEQLPIPTKEGYVFSGWFLDNGRYEQPVEELDKTMLDTNITLYAKWDNLNDNPKVNPRILITMEDLREIKIELYPDIAPISVANFLSLVEEAYYDNVIFHRIIKDFMIQTGWLYVEGEHLQSKEVRESIDGEFSSNGIENNLSHVAGVISMARAQDYNSASTQFFIVSADSTFLDGNYAAFGKVVDQESLEVVLSLSYTPTYVYGGKNGLKDFPLENGEDFVIIKSITLIE